jgi:hypothetical protein
VASSFNTHKRTEKSVKTEQSDAIRDRAWRVVEIIQGQINALDRTPLPDNVRAIRASS